MADWERRGHLRKKKLAPWQRRRRRALAVVMVFFLLLGCWLVWRLGKKTELNRAFHDAREMGVAMTVADYEATYGEAYDAFWHHNRTLSPESPYLAALEAYVLPGQDILMQIPRFKQRSEERALTEVPYADAMGDAMKTHVAANAQCLAIVHDAVQSGRVEPADFTNDELLLELLCVAACVRAEVGDGDGAFQALDDALTMLRDGDRDVGPDATPIRQTDQADHILTALRSALCRVKLSDEQVQRLQGHLMSGDWIAQQQRRQMMQLSHTVIDDFGPPVDVFNVLTGFFETYQALEIRAGMVRYEMIGKSLAEQQELIDRHQGTPLEPYLWRYAASTDLLTAALALDVVRFELAEGKLPETLDALVPTYRDSIPQDFWHDGPMAYRVEGRSFWVYSYGRDGVDNRGEYRKDDGYQFNLPGGE